MVARGVLVHEARPIIPTKFGRIVREDFRNCKGYQSRRLSIITL